MKRRQGGGGGVTMDGITTMDGEGERVRGHHYRRWETTMEDEGGRVSDHHHGGGSGW